MRAFRYAPQTIWIKAKSGNTYLCPVGVPKDAPEKELRRLCVEESANPGDLGG